MLQINLRLEGVSPLLLNRFSDEAALEASAGTRRAAPAKEAGTPRAQAEKKLYLGADGETLIVPGFNVLRSFYDGGYYHKVGRKQVTTKLESMLCSCLFISEPEIAIESREGWRVDTRPVVNPSTRGRILAHRPLFDDWTLHITIEVDERIMNVGLIRDIIDDAGTRVGLGDFRPARKGPFGRYKVTLWEQAAEILAA